jgi:SAM-dependent methyltransferase
MAETTATSYDEVPYDAYAFHETHPDRLATLAILHGLTPPDVAIARVLELGCGRGGNLIPLALAWPDARFVGIDLSPRQVADGRSIVDELGLTNIELRAQDLATIRPGSGVYDYIICHGVYSWVPEAVRERCLGICSQNLASDGVAFVSYNTLPGWHALGTIRDMMLFHIQPLADAEPRVRAREARKVLEAVIADLPDPGLPYSRSLRREVEQIRRKSDSYLLHEYLEAENHPVYFREFVSSAARHGLKYLADARFRSVLPNQPAPLRQAVERLADDPLRREQYLDFFLNRTFRRSVLVPEAARPVPPRPSALESLRALAAAGPLSARPDLTTMAPEEFVGPDGHSRFTVTDRLTKAALVTLNELWPSSVPVPELRARVQARLDGPGESGRGELLNEVIVDGFRTGIVELHSAEPGFAREVGAHPGASPYARLQSRTTGQVTNLRHRIVQLSEFDRLVLGQLDGTRDRAAILDELVSAAVSGAFPLHRDGIPINDAMEVRRILDRSLDPSLARLRGGALLIG